MSIFGYGGTTFISGGSGGGSATGDISAFTEQFIIGNAGCPIDPTTGVAIVAGGTEFKIPYSYIISNSVVLVYNGEVLPQNLSDRISYTISYSNSSTIVTMNSGVVNGDLFVITGTINSPV